MQTPFYTRRNDTKPLTAQLKDSDGVVVSLVGATVLFTMVGPGGSSTKVVDRQTVTVTDETTGSVSYPFTAVQTGTAGTFRAEFEVTFSDGTVETFPNPENLTVVITADLDET